MDKQSTLTYGKAEAVNSILNNDKVSLEETVSALTNAMDRIGTLEKEIISLRRQLNDTRSHYGLV